ncbi:hypothetical protein AD947_08800 [Acetobacter tropicalis]|uniref:Uncharacterized protein n=1 Tax=Acetobacter tropicalis TaxID=104102 RepID=A0A149TVT3_9PROT|nr:hypothetical protein [Acetobacter tropicalis]KXV57324.1 hypothetical protein AD947_08800 [Acetobacter tropicalis]
MRSINRRDAFTALGATALAGIAAAGFAKPETQTAAPVAKPEGHSPIIKARDDYFSARADIERIRGEPAAVPSHPDHADYEKRNLTACEKMWNSVGFLAHTAAKNLHDLKAKADVANLEFPEYCDAFVMDASSDEVQLAISVIADLVRLCPPVALDGYKKPSSLFS